MELSIEDFKVELRRIALSNEQLGELLGVDPLQVRKWRGEAPVPNAHERERIIRIALMEEHRVLDNYLRKK